jgi:hypothetical protein
MKRSEATLEERRVLNPAFSGALIARAAMGYSGEASEGLPFIYAYLILPFVLHEETRLRLPNAIVTRLITWTERNADLVAYFPRRLNDLSPATREGLLLITTTDVASVGTRGCIIVNAASRVLTKLEKTTKSNEVADCMKRAHFVGRWLATSGTIPTVLSSLGVRL